MVSTIATSTSHFSCFSASNETLPSSPPFRPPKLPLFWTWQKVKVGPLSVSPIGFGTWTWAWGNQLLWGYDQARDSELQGTFNLAIENRINLCDMTDSYGTGRLIGQSEKLLGKFIREFPRVYDLMSTRVLLSHYSVGTPDVVAINWCVCKGTIPIPQVKKLKQDEENLVVLGWRLSSDELLQLEYVARESPLRMTQNIFQTR